jgi:SPP1 family predicted phage head-tail adaptor
MFGYPWSGVRDPLAIPAGALRSAIQIQSQSATQDAYGQPVATWTTFLSVFAAIATVSSREVYQASQFVSQVTHRVTIRWPGTSVVIEEGQRVVYGTHTYLIQAVENVQERNRVLNLMCLEIDGSQ